MNWQEVKDTYDKIKPTDIWPGKYILFYGYCPAFNDGDPCVYSVDALAIGDSPPPEDFEDTEFDYYGSAPEGYEIIEKIHPLEHNILENYSRYYGLNIISPDGEIKCLKEYYY